jgi:hypothetical protein
MHTHGLHMQTAAAEKDEEAITMKLVRRLEQLKKEKALLAAEVGSCFGTTYTTECIKDKNLSMGLSDTQHLAFVCRWSKRKVGGCSAGGTMIRLSACGSRA